MSRTLDDALIADAVGGCAFSIEHLAHALARDIEIMIVARLAPMPWQYEQARDIAQDAVVAILDGLPRLRTPTVATYRAFVSTIVSRKVADFLRGRRRDTITRWSAARLLPAYRSDSFSSLLGSISADGLTPLSHLARSEQYALVISELAQLRSVYREVIVLTFFDQLTTRQIAEHLHLSRPAVSMIFLRAMRALSQRVSRQNSDRGACDVGAG